MSPEPTASIEIARLLTAARARLTARTVLLWVARAAMPSAVGAVAALAIPSAAAACAIAVAVLAASAAFAWTRRRGIPDRAIASAVEARTPLFRNTLVTAVELRAHPDRSSPIVAARVERDAARIAGRIAIGGLFPVGRSAGIAAAATLPIVLLLAIAAARPDLVHRARARVASSTARAGSASAAAMTIDALVTPPAYSGLPFVSLKNPDRIQALDGSRIAFTIAAPGSTLKLQTDDGRERALARDRDGRFATEMTLSPRDRFVVFQGDDAGDRHLVALLATPDDPPIVRLTAPGRDLIYPSAARTVPVAIAASDDLALRSLELRYTKVSGSGETFEFKEGAIPIDVARSDARSWQARAAVSLAGLGLGPGDTLVYRAAAADARPGGVGLSDAFVIEIGRAAEGLAEGFAIADDQARYAISQQMVILKTERLQARRGSLSAGAFTAGAQAIAAEQRMVRAEFVFMMGGEVEDEEVEAEQSHELAEGRLENRGQTDMRTAIRLMSDAERQLIAANAERALPVERAALAALERAFSRTRYILRTIAARNRIDLSRRLSGNRSGAAGWTQPPPAAGEVTPIPPLREILAETIALSEAIEWTSGTSRRAAILAERTLSLPAGADSYAGADLQVGPTRPEGGGRPEGRPLQKAAGHFIAASRRRPGTADLARVRQDLQQAANVLAPLALPTGGWRGAPPIAIGPELRGAFADALAGRSPRR